MVAASIIITLGTSFSPNVDWGAHFGGAIQGVLWGIILLGSELDNFRNKVRPGQHDNICGGGLSDLTVWLWSDAGARDGHRDIDHAVRVLLLLHHREAAAVHGLAGILERERLELMRHARTDTHTYTPDVKDA